MLRIICAGLLCASPAFADSNCAPHADVAAGLLRNYGETPQAEGMTDAGILEVYAGPAGTWTVTITGLDGQTCLVASGGQYHAIPQGVEG